MKCRLIISLVPHLYPISGVSCAQLMLKSSLHSATAMGVCVCGVGGGGDQCLLSCGKQQRAVWAGAVCRGEGATVFTLVRQVWVDFPQRPDILCLRKLAGVVRVDRREDFCRPGQVRARVKGLTSAGTAVEGFLCGRIDSEGGGGARPNRLAGNAISGCSGAVA